MPRSQTAASALLVTEPGPPPAPAPSPNGRRRGPPPLSARSRRLRKRLGVAGGVLVLAGFVSAATGFPFGHGNEAGEVPLNSVVSIDPGSGDLVTTTPVGVDPQAVAVGDGAVWVGNTTDRTVSRVSAD